MRAYLDANMAEQTSAHATARDWRRVILIGGISFAVSYPLFHFVLPVGAWVSAAPESIVSLFFAAIIAMLAMAIAAAFLARKLRLDNLRMRVAINNMSQGLCMFDGNERLVICNQRYMEMYNLSTDIVKPGCSLQSLLEYRISNGSFSRDPIDIPARACRCDGGGKYDQQRSDIEGWAIDFRHQPAYVRWRMGGDA